LTRRNPAFFSWAGSKQKNIFLLGGSKQKKSFFSWAAPNKKKSFFLQNYLNNLIFRGNSKSPPKKSGENGQKSGENREKSGENEKNWFDLVQTGSVVRCSNQGSQKMRLVEEQFLYNGINVVRSTPNHTAAFYTKKVSGFFSKPIKPKLSPGL